jgi:Leucine-rich repeat (LRR) protein
MQMKMFSRVSAVVVLTLACALGAVQAESKQEPFGALEYETRDSSRWAEDTSSLQRMFNAVRDQLDVERGPFRRDLLDFVQNSSVRCFYCALFLLDCTPGRRGPDVRLSQELLEQGLELVEERNGGRASPEELPFRFHLAVGYMREGVIASAMIHKSLLEEQRVSAQRGGKPLVLPVPKDKDDVKTYERIPLWPMRKPSVEDIYAAMGAGSASPVKSRSGRQLRVCQLGGPRVWRTTLRLLQWLPELDELDIRSSRIRGANLLLLQPLTQLKGLSLAYSYVTNDQLAHLRVLPQLESLDLSGCPVDVDGLRHIRALGNLRMLNLDDAWRISDDALRHVSKLENLECLRLGGAKIGSDGLRWLAPLTKLRELSLFECKGISMGVSELGTLKSLENLDLTYCPVRDNSLDTIGRFTELAYLSIHGTLVTSKGLANLTALQALVTLDVSCTQIDDDCIPHLAKLKNLRSLTLAGTAITNRGLEQLAAMGQLRSLDLVNTSTSAEGTEKLRRALPKCQINYRWEAGGPR